MAKLEGKIAIVTGAAQGIGLGIARVFADEGACVIVGDLQAELGRGATASICANGGNAEFIHTDVTREADVQRLIDQTLLCHGQLDVVVNNAGICEVKSAEQSTVEEWDRVMAVNMRSIFLTTKHAVSPMRQAGGGSILNVASISSYVGQKNTPAYVASKGGTLMLTKSLAVDYGPDNIRVNCICPGITDTPMLRYHMEGQGDFDQCVKKRLTRVPLGEMLYPEDMGRAAAFLCSDEAGGITGSSLIIDGGYIACAEFEG